MKRTIICIGFILILLLSGLSFNTIGENNKSIITVDDDGTADFTNIQDAIDTANDNDTIFVYSGKYSNNIIINKGIKLIGENKQDTIIFNSNPYNNNVIEIIKDYVIVNNFTIRNDIIKHNSSNIIIRGDNSSITNNIIENRNNIIDYGIKLVNCSFTSITDNKIKNFYLGGINLVNCSNAIIENNVFKNISLQNILIYQSKYINVIRNTFFGNCLTLFNSSNNIIKENDLTITGIGILILISQNNHIELNNFYKLSGNLINKFLSSIDSNNTTLNKNYWNRPRLLPKIIIINKSLTTSNKFEFLIDWNPSFFIN